MPGVQFAAGASGSRYKQSIGYTRVYMYFLHLFVSAHARVGNKLIKLLARVMRSTGPWMEICAFPFIYRFGWGRDRIRGNSVCPPPVNDTN